MSFTRYKRHENLFFSFPQDNKKAIWQAYVRVMVKTEVLLRIYRTDVICIRLLSIICNHCIQYSEERREVYREYFYLFLFFKGGWVGEMGDSGTSTGILLSYSGVYYQIYLYKLQFCSQNWWKTPIQQRVNLLLLNLRLDTILDKILAKS